MLVNHNQKFLVTGTAKLNALGASIMPDGQIVTLTQPKTENGVDLIYVRYKGKSRPGEIPDGSKFWVKVNGLAKHARQI
ncbi:MAG: hypothetical protein OQJ99_04545 [Rhodospirillales bacterium]|nr:hypothetical protein [Rhodospirillales bacterium]MCW8862163.1 hypothetical protein [Rhodospirillales bacterium]MCW8951853.1 hypothetical protein [Rhodospirillales bacterium]MCW8969664.1 hypothetical protein [Rhodospirillales bacterium]MCW9003235.1 hypothetical protein [Rhodospirillales bacterium]